MNPELSFEESERRALLLKEWSRFKHVIVHTFLHAKSYGNSLSVFVQVQYDASKSNWNYT